MLDIDLSLAETVLFMVAGILTGIINTLAGSGSLITLPVFMFICGLSAPAANATNRIGVLLQTLVGLIGFHKKGVTDFKGTYWLLLPVIAGAFLGSQIAVGLDESTMNYTIGGLMVFMFFVLLFRPERWIHESTVVLKYHRRPLSILAYFLIGIYGGFIQVGVGIFLLSALVLISKYTLRAGNGIKTLLVFALTVPSLFIFLYHDQVHFGYGILMAVFQSIGAWIGVQFAARIPNANTWIYRLLIVLVAVSALKYFY
ncbi:MAG: sulfite exporter TauE/SafE family protein [Saprospirales bacterium]|nr:sulfite exporter TauE/SafE family protein [Saprospirales bacterium]MBK8922895.1 sulfite exporter TauE/SafE family protein [Saprospirales bacterium]